MPIGLFWIISFFLVRWPRNNYTKNKPGNITVPSKNYFIVSRYGYLRYRFVISTRRNPYAQKPYTECRWTLIPTDTIPEKIRKIPGSQTPYSVQSIITTSFRFASGSLKACASPSETERESFDLSWSVFICILYNATFFSFVHVTNAQHEKSTKKIGALEWGTHLWQSRC